MINNYIKRLETPLQVKTIKLVRKTLLPIPVQTTTQPTVNLQTPPTEPAIIHKIRNLDSMYATKMAHRTSVLDEILKYFTKVKMSTPNISHTKYQTDPQNTIHTNKLEKEPTLRSRHFFIASHHLRRGLRAL